MTLFFSSKIFQKTRNNKYHLFLQMWMWQLFSILGRTFSRIVSKYLSMADKGRSSKIRVPAWCQLFSTFFFLWFRKRRRFLNQTCFRKSGADERLVTSRHRYKLVIMLILLSLYVLNDNSRAFWVTNCLNQRSGQEIEFNRKILNLQGITSHLHSSY